MPNISIFKHENPHNILCIILISLLPLSLLTGSLVINIFCVLIVSIFLYESFKSKNFTFLKTNEFLILFIFWIFLLINISLSTNFQNSYQRGFGFTRFILLVFALRYYFCFNNNKYWKIIITSWTIVFLVVTFDLLFESYFGFNTFGFKSAYSGRLAGFLNDELKIGGYYYGFIFIVLIYILQDHKKFFYIALFIFLLAALLIGERANYLKIFLILVPFVLFVIFASKIRIKYIYITLFLSILAVSIVSVYKPIYKERFYNEFIKGNLNLNLNLNNILYKSEKHQAHYDVAYKIFKDNYLFGVGLKNFRNESRKKKYHPNHPEAISGWSTHPHQIHLEFMSETGLVGYLSFLFFFISSIFIGLRNYYKFKCLYSLCGTLFIFTTFLPLIPSGSFFTTYAATIFWINYSLISLKKI